MGRRIVVTGEDGWSQQVRRRDVVYDYRIRILAPDIPDQIRDHLVRGEGIAVGMVKRFLGAVKTF